MGLLNSCVRIAVKGGRGRGLPARCTIVEDGCVCGGRGGVRMPLLASVLVRPAGRQSAAVCL